MWTKGLLKVNKIPDDDIKLSCEDFEAKFGTSKFPFGMVNGKIIPYENLYYFIYHDFRKVHLGLD